MTGTMFRKLLLVFVLAAEVLTLAVAISSNKPHGSEADRAFSRWVSSPNPQNEAAFHAEMDRLESQVGRVRKYAWAAFSANSLLLFSLFVSRRRSETVK